MKTIELTPQMNIPEVRVERSQGAAVFGESAERILEYAKRNGEPNMQKWILCQANLFLANEEAAWFYMRQFTKLLNTAVSGVVASGKDDKAMAFILMQFPVLNTKLAQEISDLFVEMEEEIGEKLVKKLILRLATLFQSECPRAAWIYLRLCTGDLSELTASHAEHGAILHRSKQGEQKEHTEALRVIKRHYPELAQAITELEKKTGTEAAG